MLCGRASDKFYVLMILTSHVLVKSICMLKTFQVVPVFKSNQLEYATNSANREIIVPVAVGALGVATYFVQPSQPLIYSETGKSVESGKSSSNDSLL